MTVSNWANWTSVQWVLGGHFEERLRVLTRRVSDSNHRIIDRAKVEFGVVKDQIDYGGYKLHHETRAVCDLRAIHAAVLGGTATHQLVSQHVEAVENHAQHYTGLASAHGF